MPSRVAVVGAGWSGATAARMLHDDGFAVEVFEADDVVGGHSRAETLMGVVYEPNGAHIFHTSNADIAAFVNRFGLTRPFEHAVVTAVDLDDGEGPRHLSWPPQVSELEALPIWPQIARELEELAPEPSGADFESYVISMMGPTLYRIFVRDYTIKQWGCQPAELSSSMAPKRVELRRDGYRRLFRDRWEYFAPRGVNEIIESVLHPVAVTCGARIRLGDLGQLARTFDAVVITAPLDEFSDCDGSLAWRGISMRSRFMATELPTETVTAAYVVNHPSLDVPFTRTVETKHASGQQILGSVVSEEFAGTAARHYPVPTVERRYERRNHELKLLIRDEAPLPVAFCGRLANYSYINQDEAIAQGMACAGEIAELA